MRIFLILLILLFIQPALAEETVTDYAINVKPLSKNAILRVIMIPHKGLTEGATLKSIQIIDNDKILYKKEFINGDYSTGFVDYLIMRGSKKTYLLYKLDIISTYEGPETYNIIEINQDTQIKEIDGAVFADSFNNPQSVEHIYVYDLIEDKYIAVTLRDNFLTESTYLEIVDDKVFEICCKELKINLWPNETHAINSLRKVLLEQGYFNIYTKPLIKEEYRKVVKIKPDTKIEILGLLNAEPISMKDISFTVDSYYKSRLLHVRLDGQDYWLFEIYLH